MELINLSKNEFKSFTVQSFKNLQNDTNFVDVTLACSNGNKIKAHKVVLSSSSQLFKEILVSNPHTNPVIYLFGIDFVYLKHIIQFIYSGEIKIPSEDVEFFLKTAEQLKVDSLDRGKNCTTNQPFQLDNPNNKLRHAVIEGSTPTAPKKKTVQAKQQIKKKKEQSCGTPIVIGKDTTKKKETIQTNKEEKKKKEKEKSCPTNVNTGESVIQNKDMYDHGTDTAMEDTTRTDKTKQNSGGNTSKRKNYTTSMGTSEHEEQSIANSTAKNISLKEKINGGEKFLCKLCHKYLPKDKHVLLKHKQDHKNSVLI